MALHRCNDGQDRVDYQLGGAVEGRECSETAEDPGVTTGPVQLKEIMRELRILCVFSRARPLRVARPGQRFNCSIVLRVAHRTGHHFLDF